MSSFYAWTKNPETGLWENAHWVDDYFSCHKYGVTFPSNKDKVYDPTYDVLIRTIDAEEAKILNERIQKV